MSRRPVSRSRRFSGEEHFLPLENFFYQDIQRVLHDYASIRSTLRQVDMHQDDDVGLSDDGEACGFDPVVYQGEAQETFGTPVCVKKKRRRRKKKKGKKKSTLAGGETQGTSQEYEQSYSEPASREIGNEIPSEPVVENATGEEVVENATGEEVVENVTGEEAVENATGEEAVENATGEEAVENATGEEALENATGEEVVENATGEEEHHSHLDSTVDELYYECFGNQATNEEDLVFDYELEENINRLMETPLVLSALEAGLEVEQVRRALKWSLIEGKEFESGDELVIHVLGEDASGDGIDGSLLGNEENVGDDDSNEWIDIEPEGTSNQENHSMLLGVIGDRHWRRLCEEPLYRRRGSDSSVDNEDTLSALVAKGRSWRPLARPALRSCLSTPTRNTCTSSISTNYQSRCPAVSTDVQTSSRSINVIGNGNNRDPRMCIICLELDVKTVFLPCRHAICCARCAREVDDCPMCRHVICERLDVYFS